MKGIYFLICLVLTNAEVYNDTIMIGDVIRSMYKPSCVISKLCWPFRKKVNMYSTLAGENVAQISMMQFLNTNTTPNFKGQEQMVVFLVDLNCPNIVKFLEESSDESLFRAPFRWILIGDSANDSETNIIPGAMLHIEMFPDSEVLLVRRLDNDSFDLHLIYKISPDSKWRTEYYGNWDKKTKLNRVENLSDTTAMRRLDLDGHQIKICYVLTDDDSINHLTDEVNDHIDTITKVNFPTTNHLFDFLKADRKYIFANTWGYKVNGTWNGMTGYLVRGEVEIGGSPMFFTSERISIVEYISSPTPTRSKFVFQQPKLSYENNLFLLSFRWTVWYSTVGLVVLLFLAILVVALWEWKMMHNNNMKFNESGVLRANVADIIILIFGAACQQGSPVELKGSLGRIVMLVLFLALMFLYTSYSANIVALLQSSSSQIRTLDDLLHSRIAFGVHDTVFNRYYFSTATEPVRKAIYEKKVAPPGINPRFMTMEEGVKMMRKGLFAFHMETGVGYKFVGKFFEEGQKCGLKEIQYLQVIDPWLAIRKNTPYKEMFKIGMKRIQEHGLQSRENRLLYERRPKCSGRGSNFVSVGMVDCYPALLVLSYGTMIALGILILENFAFRRRELKYKLSCIRDY